MNANKALLLSLQGCYDSIKNAAKNGDTWIYYSFPNPKITAKLRSLGYTVTEEEVYVTRNCFGLKKHTVMCGKVRW